jgi:CelD/BcsL family acetyltransferase involved in cellulose biosynthesis
VENLLQYGFRNGIRTIDFMPGQEAYKHIWATDYVRTESYIGPLNRRGELLLRLSRLKFSAPPAVLRHLYRILPGSWRDAVQQRLRTYRLLNGALTLKPTAEPQRTSAESQG